MGGVKVFVNNAGFDAPSTADRDITETTDDGQIIIDGLANYTGFVDLQGRANDSGALFEVYNQALAVRVDGSTPTARRPPAASTRRPTRGTWQLVIGETYWFQVDRALYLPTTAVASYGTNLPMPIAGSTASCWQRGRCKACRRWCCSAATPATTTSLTVTDAGCIGGVYGGAPQACGSGGTSDVNEDGKMDILDLTLMGGNFGKTASPAPATWTP